MPTAAATPTSPATAAATTDLQISLRELHIGEKTSSIQDIARPKLTTSAINTGISSTKRSKKTPVADSWEDEADEDDGSDIDNEPSTQGTTSPAVTDSLGTSPAVAEGPLDPPPTPISPQTSQPWVGTSGGYDPRAGGQTSRSRSTSGAGVAARDPNRRPEKQTAVAGRLIAGALGIRAPKRTEEQRAYDRAVKEQEIKRKNREKEEAARVREEEEKAKAAVWDA
ncbi:uncharacterized protein BDV14DRAFT_118861 [Aspergillus stella-maris]|uniref:uncharacterized protein n=1 Tax=Aspergillus stella-maris TaxID=1810926 RepID=UPI003CCD0545